MVTVAPVPGRETCCWGWPILDVDTASKLRYDSICQQWVGIMDSSRVSSE